MIAEWNDIKVGQVMDRVGAVSITADKLIDAIPDGGISSDFLTHEIGGKRVSYSIRQMLGSSYNAWVRLYSHGEGKSAINIQKKLWGYEGTPSVLFNTLDVDDDAGLKKTVTLNAIMYQGSQSPRTLQDMFNIIDPTKMKETFQRVRFGYDSKGIEIQLLCETKRAEVKKGDFVDPGVFIAYGPYQQSVSAGINRLVCTNGLTRRMSLWETADMTRVLQPELVNDALSLAQWLSKTQTKPIHTVRELSAMLGNKFPSKIIKDNFKMWSERIDLNSLTQFDLIDDMTRAVNSTISANRYAVLNLPEAIEEAEQKSCRCPVCSSETV